jgi:hypothetical protein
MCGRFLNGLPAAEIARISGKRNDLPNYPSVSLSRRRTIIAGEPNELVAPIRKRMPVIQVSPIFHTSECRSWATSPCGRIRPGSC